MKKNSGLTLLEMMIAVILSSLLLSIIMSLYLNVKKNYQLQMAFSQMQHTMCTTNEIMRTDIQMAGFSGCAKLNMFNKIDLEKNKITVRHLDAEHANLIATMQDPYTLKLDLHLQFQPEEVVTISDCKQMDFLKIKTVHRFKDFQQIEIMEPLNTYYEKDAEVSKFISNTYFIEKTKRKHLSGTPIFALFKLDARGKKSELVEEVAAMEANFIVDNTEAKGIQIKWLFSSELFSKTGYTIISFRN